MLYLNYIMICRPISGRRLGGRVPAATNTQATISVATQRAVNTTIEEAVFSMDPPRDFKCKLHIPVWRRGRIPPP
jgi:hypothetical protein